MMRHLFSRAARHTVFGLVAAFSVAFALALPALAHPELVAAVPAPGATVPPGLAQLTLTFNEPVSQGSQVTVYTEQFQIVADVSTHVDGNDLVARLGSRLGEGTYTVQWLALGPDGQPVEGSYQFAVSAAFGTGQGPAIIFASSLALGGLGLVLVLLLSWRRRRH